MSEKNSGCGSTILFVVVFIILMDGVNMKYKEMKDKIQVLEIQVQSLMQDRNQKSPPPVILPQVESQ